MAAQRKCGTPGCTLPDWHEGPCSTFLTEGKRKRLMVQPPPPPKKKPVVGAQSTISIPSELGAARAKRMRRVAPPSQVPAEQSSLPNGLQRFYHVHRWGVPELKKSCAQLPEFQKVACVRQLRQLAW